MKGNTYSKKLVQFQVGARIECDLEQWLKKVVEELLEVLQQLVDAVDVAGNKPESSALDESHHNCLSMHDTTQW